MKTLRDESGELDQPTHEPKEATPDVATEDAPERPPPPTPKELQNRDFRVRWKRWFNQTG